MCKSQQLIRKIIFMIYMVSVLSSFGLPMNGDTKSKQETKTSNSLSIESSALTEFKHCCYLLYFCTKRKFQTLNWSADPLT